VLHLIASGSRSNKCPAQYEDDASDRETNNQRQTDFHQNGLPPKVPNNLNNRTSKMQRPQEKPAGVTPAALSLNLHKDPQREVDAAGMPPPDFTPDRTCPPRTRIQTRFQRRMKSAAGSRRHPGNQQTYACSSETSRFG
jgi:hypothetical protein